MTIKELISEAYGTAIDKGWHDRPHSPGEDMANIHGEVSEAFEEVKAGREADEVYYRGDDPKPLGVPVELADVIIRIADFCGHRGVDLETALRLKLAYNKTRPYRHGGKAL